MDNFIISIDVSDWSFIWISYFSIFFFSFFKFFGKKTKSKTKKQLKKEIEKVKIKKLRKTYLFWFLALLVRLQLL